MSFVNRPAASAHLELDLPVMVDGVLVDSVELPISEGTITLDSTWSPYVQGSVTVPITSEEILEQINPEQYPGQRILVTATDGTAGTAFNLVIRSREVSFDGKTLTLGLESDERLLQDYARLAGNFSGIGFQTSVKGLVNYVLNQAIPGAALEPVIWDKDISAYWPLTNVMPNPSVVGSLGTYYAPRDGASAADFSTAVGGALGTTSCARWTASGTGISQLSARQHTAQEGRTYMASVYVRSPNSRSMRIRLFWRDSEGELIKQVVCPAVTAGNNWDTRITFPATAPKGTAKVGFVVERVSGTNGEFLYADMFSLVEDSSLLVTPYFDGSTTPTGYTSEWTDAAHQSPSERTPIVERLPELFYWDPGVTAWDFLEPLIYGAGLRLYCDEARKWHLVDPTSFSIPGSITVNASRTTRGTDTIDLEDKQSIDGVVVIYEWQNDFGVKQRRWDVAGTSGRVYSETIQARYPGAGRAAAILAKRSGQGRISDVTVATDYTKRPGMDITVNLPGTAEQTGQITRIDFGLSQGLMALGSTRSAA